MQCSPAVIAWFKQLYSSTLRGGSSIDFVIYEIKIIHIVLVTRAVQVGIVPKAPYQPSHIGNVSWTQ